MAFDGGFLYKIVEELKGAIDCHIEKIYQPSKDELVFLLRKKGFAKRLLITVKSGSARIHFTENKYENPQVPPNFCMLLRKYLLSARLVNINQPALERIVELEFSATNELGDSVVLRLVCELIGNQSNVILVKENGIIADSLRHSDVETAKRLILPGAKYEYPESQEKMSPLEKSAEKICNEIEAQNGELSNNILKVVSGFSPLVCREIEYMTECAVQKGESPQNALKSGLGTVLEELKSGSHGVIIYKDGKPFEFSYIDINQYGEKFPKKHFRSFLELLDDFYTQRDNIARVQSAALDIKKLLNNLVGRTQKKLALRLTELKKCENRETFRIYGELLKANLYAIKSGSAFAEVVNYYDENMGRVKIPLNPALSPQKNADKYFKDYKKTYTAEQTLTKLTQEDREELVYFDSVLDSLSRCTTLSALSEIRAELAEAGYIKRISLPKKANQQKSEFKEYVSKEGYKILVGKNNIQNDIITTRLASKRDIWFHVKNIPGSHVVVLCDGNEVSEETLLQAALLAAKNSKAANSSQVPVDYTQIKNVKKPAKAKPGMVIYTTNKTVFVNPEEIDVL
ncbi:MAG: fibronectin/fibrinogen-binding protein [Ruminococcaceae bacterium]|nr:fibronectin/fibrinogen-binding protein [Oscillospiraceae bacterium]